ncbi:MAG: SPOR domain-containing protein [Dysgonamonadaceae bacterium]|jgi:hypothetical protein|nr:SPOR domain-containing protein [Dysgonamonadaceae bacterium]
MKHLAFSFILFVAGLGCVQAQTTIIEELESNSNPAEGVIHIESDSAITALIGTPNNRLIASESYDYIERSGFRIQVFMGNDHNTARSEASSKQASIKEVFPDLATYLTYEAPNWKLSAGDFTTREEATFFKQQLQKEFPQFGKEMYIIVDKIKLPIEKQ